MYRIILLQEAAAIAGCISKVICVRKPCLKFTRVVNCHDITVWCWCRSDLSHDVVRDVVSSDAVSPTAAVPNDVNIATYCVTLSPVICIKNVKCVTIKYLYSRFACLSQLRCID